MTHFLCVATRVRDQNQLLRDWIPHYLAEGASLLLILEDVTSTQPIRSTVLKQLGLDGDPRVVVQRAAISTHQYGQAVALENAVYDVRTNCTWMVSVDADEFLTTRRTPEKSVAQVLRESFGRADFITVPWVMFGIDASMPAWQEPQSIVAENVWRWNHDLHHGEIDGSGGNASLEEAAALLHGSGEQGEGTVREHIEKSFFSGKGRDRYDTIEGKPVFRTQVLPPQTAACRKTNAARP